ncbi:MAG: hypothetical protein FJX53_16355 [Alphaproteobacteria bacterium]|nr:hypothetical protein [Alphaproteobacteria bacterium]
MAVLLAACGAGSAWVRPGVSEDVRDGDIAACRAETDSLAGRNVNIDRDIRAGRVGGIDSAEDLRDETRSYKDERRYTGLFDACMAGKGYRRAGTGGK